MNMKLNDLSYPSQQTLRKKGVIVKDNLLEDEVVKDINRLLRENTNWALTSGINTENEDSFKIANLVYCDFHVVDDKILPATIDKNIDIIQLFMRPLNIFCIKRLNINCYYPNHNEVDFHTDYPQTNMHTAIWYPQTTDGDFVLKDIGKVKALKNRAIIFPTTIPHTSLPHTNPIPRIGFNFNFFPNI
tara:strand:- start:222 stop:785 length:564 start_codon:yes stop_codon:yes gene_type:complete